MTSFFLYEISQKICNFLRRDFLFIYLYCFGQRLKFCRKFANFFARRPFFLFWEHLRVVSLNLDLGLELSCPWPWEDLSSESRSLAMASSLVSLTPPLLPDNNFFIILIFFSVTPLLQYILTIVAGVSSWINKINGCVSKWGEKYPYSR